MDSAITEHMPQLLFVTNHFRYIFCRDEQKMEHTTDGTTHPYPPHPSPNDEVAGGDSRKGSTGERPSRRLDLEASSTTKGACLSSAHGLHRLPFHRCRSAPRWRAIRRSQHPSSSSAAAVLPLSAGGLQIATIAHACCPRPPPVEDAEEV
uniref:Uncharacterized protein n=1 Tax=Oryza nivara TaxID=4536 RepID=A0A0E0HER7_ORYNI